MVAPSTYSESVVTNVSLSAKMEEFFNVCVNQIIELISGHMVQIKQKGGQPKASVLSSLSKMNQAANA